VKKKTLRNLPKLFEVDLGLGYHTTQTRQRQCALLPMLSSILGAEQRISEPPKMAHPYEIQNTFVMNNINITFVS
jgi:hypothetical protein|tara:strand:+ start:1326 stop:1550 length:225 start_codon:yes stop_codon:yes gene_type:complete